MEDHPKLGILEKEGISIDILREAPPDKVTFPTDPIYEDDVDNSTAQNGRDRKMRNKCVTQQAADN